MNKKSLTLNEFFGLIFTIIVVSLIAGFGSKIYASVKEQNYMESYDKVVATIENIANSNLAEDSTSTDLIMKKDTAIIVFIKDSDIVKNNPADYFYNRPDCEDGKTCICYCKNIPYVKGVRGERLCKGNCQPLGIDFINWFNPRQLGWPYIESEENEKFKAVEGGFIYSRDKGFPEERTIFFEKYNDFISICFNEPCINDEQKLELEK